MRRAPAVAAAAAAFALFAAGCGVQSTGVNIAQVGPFEAGPPSSSESASPSQGTYPVSLFLFSRTNKGPGVMVGRTVGSAPGPMDLPALLSEDSPLAQDDQYTSYVPAGITLKETAQKHMYLLVSPTSLGPGALQQLSCTFDQYWLAHPDPNSTIRPTTRFLLQNGQDTQWQDCTDGIVTVGPVAGPTGKPSIPEAGKSTGAG